MPRKRSQANQTANGRTWSPVKGLTIVERGPRQFQAKVRRTGWAQQSRTFDTPNEAEIWGIGVIDGFNKNTFVDTRTAARTTLAAVLDHYLANGIDVLKGKGQAASQIRQLLKSSLAPRYVGDLKAADILKWLDERRTAKVRKKERDGDGRVVKVKVGRREITQYTLEPIGEKTVLNELSRLSAAFEHARVAMNIEGIANPTQDVPKKDRPKRTERSRRLREGEKERLLEACRASRSKPLAAIVELALETAARRSEIVKLLRWEDIDLGRRTATLSGTKSVDGSHRERVIGLSSRAVEILASQGPTSSGRVFNVGVANVTRNFRIACEHAGIADLTLHDQRTEAASTMAQVKGLDIIELADQGGWKDPRTLMKYYVTDGSLRARKLDGLESPGRTEAANDRPRVSRLTRVDSR